MKIKSVKFFQAVQIKTATSYDTVSHAEASKYDIVADGNFLKLSGKGHTESYTLTTFQNVQYAEVLNERPKEKGATGTSKTATVQN